MILPQFDAKKFILIISSKQGRRQLREIGGEGGIKIRGAKVFAEMRKLFLAEITKRSSPNSEGFFWPKSQIFRPCAGDLQKKKYSPKSKGFLWLKSQILTFFPPKNANFFLSKNHRGGQEKNRGGKNENCPPVPPLATRLLAKLLIENNYIGIVLEHEICNVDKILRYG